MINTDAIDKLLKADLETMNNREIADLMLGNQTDALAQLEALKQRIHELEHPWRPIESAPKDGTEMWLWEGSDYRGHWSSRAEKWFSGGINIFPTHWMPLPTPPEGEKE